jgi:hypothetical protein
VVSGITNIVLIIIHPWRFDNNKLHFSAKLQDRMLKLFANFFFVATADMNYLAKNIKSEW